MGEHIRLEALKLNQFEHIRDVTPFDTDDECLRDLKDVLVKHGCEQRLGITLLHKHFDLAEDEVMVERCDPEARMLTMQPVKRSEIGANVIETMWRFEGDRMTGAMECEAFCPTGPDGQHYGYKDHYS